MMDRGSVLAKINEVVSPVTEITEETNILESGDLDSLAIFNILFAYKVQGINLSFKDVLACKNVGDLVSLILSQPAAAAL